MLILLLIFLSVSISSMLPYCNSTKIMIWKSTKIYKNATFGELTLMTSLIENQSFAIDKTTSEQKHQCSFVTPWHGKNWSQLGTSNSECKTLIEAFFVNSSFFWITSSKNWNNCVCEDLLNFNWNKQLKILILKNNWACCRDIVINCSVEC